MSSFFSLDMHGNGRESPTWVKGKDGQRHRAFKCMFCGELFIESLLTEHELKCKEEHERREQEERGRQPSFTQRLKGYLHEAKEMFEEARKADEHFSEDIPEEFRERVDWPYSHGPHEKWKRENETWEQYHERHCHDKNCVHFHSSSQHRISPKHRASPKSHVSPKHHAATNTSADKA